MLDQLPRTLHDPELDAPPASQLREHSQKDLFLAAFVVPLIICLVVHLATRLLKGRNSNNQASRTAGRGRAGATPSPEAATHRHRRSLNRAASTEQATPHQVQQPHSTRLSQRQYCHSMDHHQQQHASPQTDRPFRRTQNNGRPPSPQSERPFRVTQSQRVYSTPDGISPTGHSNPAHQPGTARTQTPHTDRPFRVSHSARSQHLTPQANGPASAGPAAWQSASPPISEGPFRFREFDTTEQHQPLSNGTPGTAANGPTANGVPLLFTTYGGLPQAQQQYQQEQGQQQNGYYYPSEQQVQQQYQQQQWHHQQQQQQHGGMSSRRRTPVWGMPPHASAADGDDSDDDYPQAAGRMQQPQHAWDEDLLHRCAEGGRYIASLDALQVSPEYRQYITQARKRQLTFEQKEKHKLNVYKALRNVDPEAFKKLFTRDDVLEYDEVPLSRPLAVLELLLSSVLTFTLVGLPIWLPGWRPLQVPLALLWLLLQLLAVSRYGCTSLPARALSIYASQGPYSMQPGWWSMLAAVLLDAALVVLLPGLGLLASLACRLLTEQRQSCGERLLRLQPMREVVRPMHFSPYSPGSHADGITSDEE